MKRAGSLITLGLLSLALPAGAAVTYYTIASTADTTPTSVSPELRYAIEQADSDGTDSIIQFDPSLHGQSVVLVGGALNLSNEDRTWIQGPGSNLITIEFTSGSQGFEIETSANCISDLSIFKTNGPHVLIDGSSNPAQTNWIWGCHLGLDASGAPVGGLTNAVGVHIQGSQANWNLVGTDGGSIPGLNGEPGSPPANISAGAVSDEAEERNIISGNTLCGVRIESAQGNRVAGNFIGTDVSGAGVIPNGNGIEISAGATENTIGVSDISSPINFLGGGEIHEWNIISGSIDDGVVLEDAGGNWISGNLIGTNVLGSGALGNGGFGVYLVGTASSNTIGTDGDGSSDAGFPGTGGEQNVISGNGNHGIFIIDATTLMTHISGNHIGVDITGSVALANNGAGVDSQAPQCIIGTDSDGVSDGIEGNVISGNGWHGIYIVGGPTLVWGNIIGLDASASTPLPNGFDGIHFSGGSSFVSSIGVDTDGAGSFLTPTPTPTAAQRNVIAGNLGSGVLIENRTTVIGNWIGTNALLDSGLGNGAHGVMCTSSGCKISTGPSGAWPNVIWNNGGDGVRIDGAFSSGNLISRNSISGNVGSGIENINGGNNELAPPIITTVDLGGGSVSGTTDLTVSEPATVEVFCDVSDEGEIYLGYATVAANSWNLTGITWPPGPCFVTTSVTDSWFLHNTSEFSQWPIAVPVELSVFSAD
jgi:hypothetical protein